ncbi:HsdM family class I SAM-dependent methyltransferase [Vibrio crassostreae]|uniref:HsdM family class I SAM-dependent methyltransferase n=1 Tax=Vibrio crassostreae TaxID=246167 RepID=UPI001B312D90
MNDRPEYVVKIDEDSFYIIEAKAELKDIDKAFFEAKAYAEKINSNSSIVAKIISGVAGNDDDGYLVKSAVYLNGYYHDILHNERELTGLISKEIAHELLSSNKSSIDRLKINEKQLLATAEKINEDLHLGSINKDERASVMATILLSLVDDTKPNYNASASVLVKDINNRAEEVLISHNKREFFKHVAIKLPSKDEAKNKYRKALVSTILKLKNINIKAAMNSGTDVLGKFYEVFLKYGNGAKDIGIVLTPRHVTEFGCEVIDVTHKDVVLDPTCGTGGFLVSAFDKVRRDSEMEQLKEFKKHRIFGVEQQPKVAALAIVNMIFRGDGSNNIIDDNFLSLSLKKLVVNASNTAEYAAKGANKELEPVNKVLMNPPFALKSKDEKEYKFVQHALEQMEDGGLLFAIIPTSVLTKSGDSKAWRKNQLLSDNTLMSVITLPDKLFYPVGVHTCACIIRKGKPHDYSKSVYWAKVDYDGYFVKKGKRLHGDDEIDQLTAIRDELKVFISTGVYLGENIEEFKKVCPLDKGDDLIELIPEVYLDQRELSSNEVLDGVEELVRETAAFIIRSKKEGDFI